MSEWLLQLPVVWMALVIFAGTYFIAAVVSGGTTRLAVNELPALSIRGCCHRSDLSLDFCCFHRRPGWGDLERAGSPVATEA